MAEAHHTPNDKLYLGVFGALAVLTGISFMVSETLHSRLATILLVMGMATVKAFLVATFFMHLNWDWSKVRVMLVAAAVLSAVLVIALIPDIVRAQRDKPNPAPVAAAPAPPAGTSSPPAHHD